MIRPFTAGEISDADLGRMANEAYATFRHAAVVPLDQTSPNQFILELFHGPTLAFKDVAMQLLSRLMDHVLAKRNQRTTIVVATSGDTGGAAVDAFAGLDNVDLVVLFPNGRISDVQRRMMTTQCRQRARAVRRRHFRRLSALVKELFNHHAFAIPFRSPASTRSTGRRIVARRPINFTSAVGSARRRAASISLVPTGKLRRHFAGLCGKAVGCRSAACASPQRQRHSGAHACQRRL